MTVGPFELTGLGECQAGSLSCIIMDEQPRPAADSQEAAVSHFIQKLYSGCPRVIVIPAILVINVAVFIFLLSRGAGISGENLPVYIEYGANLGALTKTDEWWRLFTAVFLHYGVLHLGFNMWVLWDAGRLTERLFGHFNLAWIYIFSGLLASLSSLYWNQDDVASIGASGAVFGIFGALIGYLLQEKQAIPQLLQRQLLRSALIFTGITLFLGATIPAIDNAAHVGGLVSGLILGLLLAKPLDHKRPPVKRALLAHAGSITLLALAIILSPPPFYDYPAQQRAEDMIREFIKEEKALIKEWKAVVNELQSGEAVDEPILLNQLTDSLNRWSRLSNNTSVSGKIQPETERRIRLLKEYTEHRIDNIRIVMQFLEAPDESLLQQLKQNNEAIREVMQKLNSPGP